MNKRNVWTKLWNSNFVCSAHTNQTTGLNYSHRPILRTITPITHTLDTCHSMPTMVAILCIQVLSSISLNVLECLQSRRLSMAQSQDWYYSSLAQARPQVTRTFPHRGEGQQSPIYSRSTPYNGLSSNFRCLLTGEIQARSSWPAKNIIRQLFPCATGTSLDSLAHSPRIQEPPLDVTSIHWDIIQASEVIEDCPGPWHWMWSVLVSKTISTRIHNQLNKYCTWKCTHKLVNRKWLFEVVYTQIGEQKMAIRGSVQSIHIGGVLRLGYVISKVIDRGLTQLFGPSGFASITNTGKSIPNYDMVSSIFLHCPRLASPTSISHLGSEPRHTTDPTVQLPLFQGSIGYRSV
jgi:hypothetical protein